MKFNWQNLSSDDDRPRWPRQGRAWWGRLRFEWSLFKLRCAVGIEQDPADREWTATLAVPLVGTVWLSVRTDLFMPRDYRESRECRIELSNGHLRWSWWHSPMEWNASDPWWRYFSLDLFRILFGKTRYRSVQVQTVQARVPMPEGEYMASAVLHDDSWRRSRLPFAHKRLRRATLDVPGGIPFEGKGENSYDQGRDGLYGITCPARTVEEGVAAVVESVLTSRRKHGWDGAPGPHVLTR